MGWNSKLKCGLCCLQNPETWRARCLFMVVNATCGNCPLTLEWHPTVAPFKSSCMWQGAALSWTFSLTFWHKCNLLRLLGHLLLSVLQFQLALCHLYFYLLILKREKHWFVVLLIHLFIDSGLCSDWVGTRRLGLAGWGSNQQSGPAWGIVTFAADWTDAIKVTEIVSPVL